MATGEMIYVLPGGMKFRIKNKRLKMADYIPTVELFEEYKPTQEILDDLPEIPNKIRFLVEGSPNMESKNFNFTKVLS